MISAHPPIAPVYRIANRQHRPFEPPPWELAFPDGTFHNRFDDPTAASGTSESERFRVIYCATQRAGAFAETTARFRPQLRVLAGLDAVIGKEDAPDDMRLRADPDDPAHCIVPQRWLATRQVCPTYLDPSLHFVDIMAGKTIHRL